MQAGASFTETFGTLRKDHVVTACGRVEQHLALGQQQRPLGIGYALRSLHTIFLPEGFPTSVGPDYVHYQVYDVAQALCAAVTGTLSTRAVLAGVGVGSETASVVSGTLQWIVRDGTGMVGRIYFASRIASDLDNDMKRWRIAADVCNDVGVMLEIACSMVPRRYFVPLVCSAAIIKAVTAVAGQATRSTMAQHFARRDNMADISAKNASQETAVSFIGMFVGMAVAAFVPPTMFYNSLVFIIVTILHLYLNVRAVRTLVLRHFNQVRLDIAIALFVEAERNQQKISDAFPTPHEMRLIEGIVNQNPHAAKLPRPTATVELGACLSDALVEAPAEMRADLAAECLRRLSDDKFVALHNRNTGIVHVVLSTRAKSADIMRAYVLVQLAPDPRDTGSAVAILHTEAEEKRCESFIATAHEKGWALDRALFKLKEWRVDVGAALQPSHG